MSNELAERPEVLQATTQVAALESKYATYVCRTPAEYEFGAADLKEIKSAQATIDAMADTVIKPAHATWKAAIALFAGPKQRLSTLEARVKGVLIAFNQEQERIRAAAQRKLDEEARREQQRLQAIADRAAAKGDESKAERFQERAQTVVAPVVSVAVPKVAGLSSRESWKFEIIDESKVPRAFLIVDAAKVGALVRSMKGDAASILGDGVRVYREDILASGRG